MGVAEILAELVAREEHVPPGTLGPRVELIVSERDLEAWAASTGLSGLALLDELALALARRYSAGELSFTQCDLIVNDLYSCSGEGTAPRAEVFWSVFNAFDEGEYYHGDDPSEDAEQTYTRPQIEEVLRRNAGR